ncbi:MAG TPA: cytochrome c oxidase subunit II [Solirubrobacteraceae bacterium]|nr:cytochrome c oxidase subunit II [Solirubrobacteraceae bacterium]
MRRSTTNDAGWKLGRKLTLTCGLTMLVGMVAAPAAMAGILLPESGGSPNADQIASLYKITLYVALVIFIGVEGALVYALYKFRARKGAVAAQIHGNTRLEIGWTLGAALILVVLGAVTFTKLDSIRNPPNSGPGGLTLTAGVDYQTTDALKPPNGKSLNIQVNGQQYVWRFTYPGGKLADGLDDVYSYEKMVVPINTTVTLDIVSQDVVHSWWIPQLGGKFDAVPGYPNHTWFKISKPGVYKGQCAFLCGRLHARMIAEVDAVTPAQYTAWLAQQKQAISTANAAAEVARATLAKQTGAASVANP